MGEERNDPNAGSMVLFQRGIDGDGQPFGEWETGYVASTFFVHEGRAAEPSFDHPEYEPWVEIVPAAPEGRSAPTTLTVPMLNIDPIVHGSELGS